MAKKPHNRLDNTKYNNDNIGNNKKLLVHNLFWLSLQKNCSAFLPHFSNNWTNNNNNKNHKQKKHLLSP